MTYTFHWEVPLQNLPQFLWGALATLEMSGVACLLGSLVAVAGALARLSKNKYLRPKHPVKRTRMPQIQLD